jgi:hypothetical protein
MIPCYLRSNRPAAYGCLALLIVAGISSAFAQDLIIRDPQGQPLIDPIELTGELAVTAGGNVEAVTSQVLECGSGFTCDDVAVGPLSFSVVGETGSSVTVTEGNPLTFQWYARGAWQCEAGGFPGWDRQDLPPDSTRLGTQGALAVVPTDNLASETPYTATLLCRNGPVESDAGVARELSITVEEGFSPGPIEGCEERGPPSGWTRLGTGSLSCRYESGWIASADCRYWEETLTRGGVWPSAFLETGGLTRRLGVGRFSPTEYYAIEFNTVGLPASGSGRMVSESPGQGLTSTRKIATISTCPGDFNRTEIMAETGCYQVFSTFNAFEWGGPSTSEDCKLQPDTRYFFNVIHTSSPEGTPTNSLEPNCPPGQRCGFVISPGNQQ